MILTDGTKAAAPGADHGALLERAVAAALEDCSPSSVRWNYENGLILSALWACGENEGSGIKPGGEELLSAVKQRIDALIDSGGSISGYRKDEFNIDQVNAGKVVLSLWKRYGEERYRKAVLALLSQMAEHPRTASGSFWHKKIYPHQVWLDGLYMAGPFLARCAREFSNPALLDDVCAQLLKARDTMRDPGTGLYFHARDESKAMPWSNPATGLSPHVWGRAVGWLAMALADTLPLLPASHPQRGEILAMFPSLMAAVARAQDDSGLWHQVMDQPGREGNYLETSASAMFAYALLKGLRLGYLVDSDPPGLGRAAAAAMGALASQRALLDGAGRFHLSGICKVAGLGGSPYRDGSFAYYVNEPVVADDYKGTGPYILALNESLALGDPLTM